MRISSGVWKWLSAAATIVAFLAFFLSAENSIAPRFHKCISQVSAYQAAKDAYQHGFIILNLVRAQGICSLSLIDKHNGFFALLGTIVIAIFAVVLAGATERQVRLTKESLVADKKAFVYATGPAQFWTMDEKTRDYVWHFRAQWQNSGDTPTKNMRMFAECEVRTSPLPEGFDFDRPTIAPGSAFIPPKGSVLGGLVPTPGRAAISPQDILDAQSNKKFIYMWGWAKYEDVFPGTPQHITRFCWLIMSVGDPKSFAPGTPAPAQGSLGFSSIYHSEGNCADDECG